MMRTLFVLGAVALVLLALPGIGVLAADLLGYGPGVNAWLESRLGVSHRVAISLPAAAALFAVPPIIVLLYFLRLKRKPIAVSSTFLWKKSVEDLHVNRLMQWLRRNFLLLLQVFAALMMIYGILGPRLHGALSGGRRYILVIDNSASMSATDVAPTRLDWAKGEALKEIDRYADDADIGMVIVFSDTAEIRQSFTGSKGELRAAVASITPTERPTRIDEALTLAASLANPDRSGDDVAAAPANPEPGKERTYVAAEGVPADLHIYSDGKYPAVPDFALAKLDATYHPPRPAPSADARASDNVAVLRFDADRDAADPTKVIARAVVRNYRDRPASVAPRVEVLAGGTRLISTFDDDASRASKKREPFAPLTTKADLTFTIPDVQENADVVLRLTLDGAKDAFPLDDQAWVALGVSRRARVLVVGPDNRPTRFALDSPSVKRLAEVAYLPASALSGADPKAYPNPAREGKYDLIVYDRCGPDSADSMPAANTLFLGTAPPGITVGATVKGVNVRGKTGDHPVLKNLQALDEVGVREAVRLTGLPPRSERLIEGLTDSGENLVLLAAVPRGAFTDLVQAFPVIGTDGQFNTDWPLKVGFPLFWRNVVLAMGNVRDSATEEPVKPGQVKPLRLGGTPAVTITPPGNGAPVKLERGARPEFLVAGTDRAGVYAVAWDEPGRPDMLRRFAVNLFDPVESDLAVPADEQLVIGRTVVKTTGERKQPRDLWKVPVLLGLLALLAEWWIYNKRVQI